MTSSNREPAAGTRLLLLRVLWLLWLPSPGAACCICGTGTERGAADASLSGAANNSVMEPTWPAFAAAASARTTLYVLRCCRAVGMTADRMKPSARMSVPLSTPRLPAGCWTAESTSRIWMLAGRLTPGN